MAVKYYSERTGKFFDTAEACEKAEFEAKEAENREKILKERKEAEEKALKEKLSSERKARATEVDEARKAMVAAQNKYRETLQKFIKDYHTYHYSTSDFNDIPTLFEFFNYVL